MLEDNITSAWKKWIKSWYKESDNIENIKESNFLNKLIDKYRKRYNKYSNELEIKCKKQNDADQLKINIEKDIEDINKNINRLNKCLEDFNSKECKLNFGPAKEYEKAINKEVTSQGMLINTINDTNKIIYEIILLLIIISMILYLLYKYSSISKNNFKNRIRYGNNLIRSYSMPKGTTTDYIHHIVNKIK